MDDLLVGRAIGRASRCRILVLALLLAMACEAKPAATPEATEPAPAASARGVETTASVSAAVTTSPGTLEAPTTLPADRATPHQATVVAVWGQEDAAWLLVDLAEGEPIAGSRRVVVALDEPDVDCAGRRAPVIMLRAPEQVTFELLSGVAAEGPPDMHDLRWEVPVAVAGRDVRIVCPSRAELTATIAAQRAKWAAAGARDYEFTLHWGIFNLTAGDYRVAVTDGQPGVLTRLGEPVVEPDAPPVDLSEVPASIEDVFERLEAALGADRVVACYDAELGYPVDVRVDDDLNGVDDELTMAVSEMAINGSPTRSSTCGERAEPMTGSMACDVYVVGPDGSVGTTAVRTGVRGFSTVAEAELPDQVAEGERFVVTVPGDSQVLTSTAEQYSVVTQRDFVRVFGVTGGSIVAGSVAQTPAENAPANSDEATVSLGFTATVAGGDEVAFPAARFEVVPADAATSVEVSLLRYESTLDLRDINGAMLTIRAVCAVDPNVLAVATVS
jgi:hypothetical protein